MRWLWFVGALVCFAVVFKTTSMGLALLCLLGALVCMITGTLAVAAQRIDSRRNDTTQLLGPEEIRAMREAEAKKAAARDATENPGGEPNPQGVVGAAAAAAMIAAETGVRTGDDDTPPARQAGNDPESAT